MTAARRPKSRLRVGRWGSRCVGTSAARRAPRHVQRCAQVSVKGTTVLSSRGRTLPWSYLITTLGSPRDAGGIAVGSLRASGPRRNGARRHHPYPDLPKLSYAPTSPERRRGFPTCVREGKGPSEAAT